MGSEFHLMPPDGGEGYFLLKKGCLTVSGRTAIGLVLEQVEGLQRALLPDWCCESMVSPFRDAGIEVSFYGVGYDERGLSVETPCYDSADVLLLCHYFGFRHKSPEFRGFNGTVIEDITHSIMSEELCDASSDYLVASLRKWGPMVSGGYCAGPGLGELEFEPPDKQFVDCKIKAMRLKARYLDYGLEADKQVFLNAFAEANAMLAVQRTHTAIDAYSKKYLAYLNVPRLRDRRRENARTLYRLLRNRVRFLFPETDMECPLFVPVLLPGIRDRVRGLMVERDVYCPVHWPRHSGLCASRLFDDELSLVCDQRYGEADMEREADALLRALDEVR